MGKRIRKYIMMALAGVMLVSVTGCNMIQRTEESKGKTVLAKVGDKKITRADVDEELEAYFEQFKEQYGDDFESNESLTDTIKKLRQQELEQLVDQEVLLQNQEALGVDPSDDELQSEADDKIASYKEAYGSDDAFEEAIQQYGFDDDSFNEYVKQQTLLSMIYEAMFADLDATDEEIESYYNENIDQYTTKAGADVTHLLFTPETDSDGNAVDGADEAAKALAEKARAEAVAGTSLEDLANSDEFKDKCKYEDLGRVSFEDSGMVQEFEDAFKVLPANQVSDVVQTQYGYHIIVNTAVYPDDEVQPLDDTLKETVKSAVLNQKEQDEYDTRIEQMKEDLNVKTYEDRL